MQPNTEPVSWAGAITTIIESALLLLISFGVIDVTEDQVQMILALVVAVTGAIGPMLWARSQVTPLVEPTDEDGTPLVRQGGGIPQAQARAMRG